MYNKELKVETSTDPAIVGNTVLATVDYYKECPFTVGLIYTEGIYKGRYDVWNNYFGAFIFDCNGEQRLIHPTDTEKIQSVNLL